jgi:hypothetical protein
MRAIVGSILIFLASLCTLMIILGIWGVVGGSLAWQIILTLISIATGFVVIGEAFEKYFA